MSFETKNRPVTALRKRFPKPFIYSRICKLWMWYLGCRVSKAIRDFVCPSFLWDGYRYEWGIALIGWSQLLASIFLLGCLVRNRPVNYILCGRSSVIRLIG